MKMTTNISSSSQKKLPQTRTERQHQATQSPSPASIVHHRERELEHPTNSGEIGVTTTDKGSERQARDEPRNSQSGSHDTDTNNSTCPSESSHSWDDQRKKIGSSEQTTSYIASRVGCDRDHNDKSLQTCTQISLTGSAHLSDGQEVLSAHELVQNDSCQTHTGALSTSNTVSSEGADLESLVLGPPWVYYKILRFLS